MAAFAFNIDAKYQNELINKRTNLKWSFASILNAKAAKNPAFLTFLMLF